MCSSDLPPGVWEAVASGRSKEYTAQVYKQDQGDNLHRRSLYTFWKRLAPPPGLAAFDAPSRETCTVRRINSNTPLQAFVTLNDPVYVEAAQALARRILKEGGTTPEQRAKWALELVHCRPATDAQVKHVLELCKAETEAYRADKKAAEQMATEPLGPLPQGTDAAEAAAWTVVANVLLSLDAVLTKG